MEFPLNSKVIDFLTEFGCASIIRMPSQAEIES